MNSEDTFNGCTNLKLLSRQEKQEICPGCSFTYNKAISASFDMTISNKFLQLQLINWGRSTQSFVKFSFPCSFLLRATNTKHLIDTEESLKLLHKNKISYVQPGWKMLSKMIIYFYWCTSKYDVFLSVNWLSHYKSRKLFMKKSFTSGIVSKLQRPLQISK